MNISLYLWSLIACTIVCINQTYLAWFSSDNEAQTQTFKTGFGSLKFVALKFWRAQSHRDSENEYVFLGILELFDFTRKYAVHFIGEPKNYSLIIMPHKGTNRRIWIEPCARFIWNNILNLNVSSNTVVQRICATTRRGRVAINYQWKQRIIEPKLTNRILHCNSLLETFPKWYTQQHSQ